MHTSWLQRLPGAAGPLRRWLLPLFPSAVTDLSRKLAAEHARSPVDLLISTSSAAIKGLRPPPGVPHLCYCHAPARYLWSQTEEYARGRAGGLRTLGLRAFGPRLRAWDRRTSSPEHVTRFLANSSHIARVILRCYARESCIVFPPVDTEFFTPDPAVQRARNWLYAGALEPYKRVDLLIAAAARASHPLVIVGDGSQAAHLRSIAGPTVEFRGRCSDDALRREYRSARMLMFPQVEDFGIVAAEAQACGTPVLAFGAGGALDTVIPGSTGAYFHQPTDQALLDATSHVPECTPETSARCRTSAERFAESTFREAIIHHVSSLIHFAPAADTMPAGSAPTSTPFIGP